MVELLHSTLLAILLFNDCESNGEVVNFWVNGELSDEVKLEGEVSEL